MKNGNNAQRDEQSSEFKLTLFENPCQKLRRLILVQHPGRLFYSVYTTVANQKIIAFFNVYFLKSASNVIAAFQISLDLKILSCKYLSTLL